jgi:hypothetical protein
MRFQALLFSTNRLDVAKRERERERPASTVRSTRERESTQTGKNVKDHQKLKNCHGVAPKTPPRSLFKKMDHNNRGKRVTPVLRGEKKIIFSNYAPGKKILFCTSYYVISFLNAHAKEQPRLFVCSFENYTSAR